MAPLDACLWLRQSAARRMQRYLSRPWHAHVVDMLLHGHLMLDLAVTAWHPVPLYPKEGSVQIRNVSTAQVCAQPPCACRPTCRRLHGSCVRAADQPWCPEQLHGGRGALQESALPTCAGPACG